MLIVFPIQNLVLKAEFDASKYLVQSQKYGLIHSLFPVPWMKHSDRLVSITGKRKSLLFCVIQTIQLEYFIRSSMKMGEAMLVGKSLASSSDVVLCLKKA